MVDFKTLCGILVVIFAIIMIIVGTAILCRKCFERDNNRQPNQTEIVQSTPALAGYNSRSSDS